MAPERRYRVQLSKGARADIEGIARYLSECHSPELADRWLVDLLDRVDSLERYPERGSIPQELEQLGTRRYRQLLLHPYRLFYRVMGDLVTVTLVADGRRDIASLVQQRLLRD